MDADLAMDLIWCATAAGALGGIGAGLLAGLVTEVARALRLIDRIPQGPDEAPDRGMGRRPMADLSRATCPMAPGGECPARRVDHASDVSVSGGDAGRRGKHGAGPRPAAPASPRPHSRLGDNVPQALPPGVLGAGGGGSGGKQGFPEDSASLPLYLAPLLVLGACGDGSGGKHGFPEDSASRPDPEPAASGFADTVPVGD
ncbi:hypothetical protein Aave_3599 [Paracidovorax citrulli AAC00-1]|uniref:Uncharacterized protein n=1 Tax=Paracidovorax citrulli (strain AAC00-1) TaxID=397945 RepID=A1TT62_PARC0|nr:hypothetical protein Aave_3599 [Paracidovorax citrulli AAC00-1]